MEQLAASGPEAAVYTLKEYDYTWNGKTYLSLKRLYLEACDPTEYNFANKYLCDWRHWETICALEWFKPHVEEWRKELQLKLRAAALAGMIEDANGTGREAQAARKYLLDGGWEKRNVQTKGRPSKAQINKAAHEIAGEASTVKEHYHRLIQAKAPEQTQ